MAAFLAGLAKGAAKGVGTYAKNRLEGDLEEVKGRASGKKRDGGEVTKITDVTKPDRSDYDEPQRSSKRRSNGKSR